MLELEGGWCGKNIISQCRILAWLQLPRLIYKRNILAPDIKFQMKIIWQRIVFKKKKKWFKLKQSEKLQPVSLLCWFVWCCRSLNDTSDALRKVPYDLYSAIVLHHDVSQLLTGLRKLFCLCVSGLEWCWPWRSQEQWTSASGGGIPRASSGPSKFPVLRSLWRLAVSKICSS